MPEQRLSTALPNQVHERELQTVSDRRAAAQLEALETPEGVEQGAPSMKRGLVGLTLSGGGIRSSTFSLGVLQSLARVGVFKRFDFMSTVSGGGYTGSMLSSLLRDKGDAGPTGDDFPLAKPDGEEEPGSLQHLRNGSNYLNPGGLLNTLRLPAVVLRGLLLNLLLILPWMMLAVWVTEWIHETVHISGIPLTSLTEELRDNPSTLGLMALLILGFYLGIAFLAGGAWSWRDRYEHTIAIVLAVAVGGVALGMPLIAGVHRAIQYPLYGPDGLGGFLVRNFQVEVWAVPAVIIVSVLALVKASEKLSGLAGKLMMYFAAVAGPGLLIGLYLLMLVA